MGAVDAVRVVGVARLARLALFGAAAVLVSACASVSLDEPLEGTPWRLVQLDGQRVAPAGGDPQAEPRIQFNFSDARLIGSGGCNRLSGSYRLRERVLRIGPIAATRATCADPARTAIETRFVAVLEATASFDLKGQQLTLLDARALPLAVLELGLRGQP